MGRSLAAAEAAGRGGGSLVAARGRHWLNGTWVALMWPTIPAGVTDTFWMVRPNGSFGIVKLKFWIGCSSEAGMPLLPTSVTLSSCGLGRVTRQGAAPAGTARSRPALVWAGPA